MQDEDQARKTETIQGTFFCLLINIDLLSPRGKIHILKIYMVYSEVGQSCPTLCDPVDCSPPGSSVHGILQARILEWVTISLSRGSSQPKDRTQVSLIADKRFNL